MSLYFSTSCPELPAEDAVAALLAEGFGHLLAVGAPRFFARVVRPPGAWILALQEPSLNFASDDLSRWEHSLALAKECLVIAGAFGAPQRTLPPGNAVHGGLDANGQPDSGPRPRPQANLRLLRALDQLASHADRHGVALSLRLQAAWDRDELLTTPEEADQLLHTLGAPHVGLGLDLGHLKLNAVRLKRDPDNMVEAALDRSNLVWLHGNEGRRDEHARPRTESWEMSQLARPPLQALPLVYDARKQPLAEIRAVAGWLAESFAYQL